MADVRCPMCGKPNPADADICLYCQARLKPLTAPLGPGAGRSQPPPTNQPPKDNSTDWLHGLLDTTAASEEPAAPPTETPAEPTQGQSDWLARIRQRTKEEQDAFSKIGTPPDINKIPANPPEIGSRLSSISDKPGVYSSSADDVASWLTSLRAGDEPVQPAQPVPPSSPTVEQSDGEWLRSLTDGSYPEPLIEPEPESPAAAPLHPEPPFSTAAQSEAESSTTDIPDRASHPDLGDWLRDMEPPPAEAKLPSTGFEALPGKPPAAVASDGETPDWLTGFSSATPAEPEAAPADMPDWLKNLRPTDGLGQETEADPIPAGEIPDWLREFGMPPMDKAPVEPAVSAFAEEIPDRASHPDFGDWLRDLQEQSTAAASQPSAGYEAQPAESISSEEAPDWLKEYPSTQPAAGPSKPMPSTEDSWQNSFASVAPIHEELPPQPLAKAQAEPFSPFNENPLPEWMNGEPVEPEGAVQFFTEGKAPFESVPPFASTNINELLAGVAPEDKASSEIAGRSEPEPLEPAQLPNWLQAMRPVESTMANVPSPSADDDQRLEKSGPLAGLRGVLPGEELASQYRKPPVYTNKLRVSDKQHLHTNLLEAILTDEAKSQPIPGEPTQAPQLIMRLLVAAILILLVIIPPLVGVKLPVPANLVAAQPAMTAAFISINELPTGATVLVAADFEAGLTGEMKAAAEPLLRHLQTHQPKLVLASTLPAGPVLGELLLKESGSTPAVNLGYIAGGSNALKLFGLHASPELPTPLQQAAPFPYNKDWSDPALQALRDVTVFQRIIVLTDSIESARAWVEQVQPALDADTQLVMVSSAQAAPLVQAYVESGQVRGLVSGLAGGAAYEQLTHQPGVGTSSWTAYQLSLVTIVILIVVGGLVAGISALFRRSQTKRKA